MGDGMTHAYRAARAESKFDKAYNQAMTEYWLLGDKRTYKNLSVAKLMEFLLHNAQRNVEISKQNYFVHKKYGLNDIRESISEDEAWQYQTMKLYSASLNINGVYKEFRYKTSLRDALEHAYVFVEWMISPEGEKAVIELIRG